MIKNVIFDVGKVLVDYYPDIYMESLGLNEEERKVVNEAMFDNPLWAMADAGVYPAEEFLPRFIAQKPEYESQIKTAYDHLDSIIQLYPYVIEWMEDLKSRGLHLFVLSNYPEFLYEKTKPRMAFLPYLDGAIFSAFEKDVKPHESIYRLLLDRYGLAAAECVFIDDREENVQGAGKAGIHGILFEGYESANRQLLELL